MSSPVPTGPEVRDYVLLSPDGSHFVIPKEVFDGISNFMQGSKPTGFLTIHFKQGGVAGVEANTQKWYKGQPS